jgi:hypothetical protein
MDFDELRLVQNQGAEIEFGKRGQIAAQQGVIRDDDVMLRNLFRKLWQAAPLSMRRTFRCG